jgi:hypothetical protein
MCAPGKPHGLACACRVSLTARSSEDETSTPFREIDMLWATRSSSLQRAAGKTNPLKLSGSPARATSVKQTNSGRPLRVVNALFLVSQVRVREKRYLKSNLAKHVEQYSVPRLKTTEPPPRDKALSRVETRRPHQIKQSVVSRGSERFLLNSPPYKGGVARAARDGVVLSSSKQKKPGRYGSRF